MTLFFIRLRRGSASFARVAVVGALTVALAGCVAEHHACTAIGCTSQVSMTIRTPTGTWPDGAYELTVRTGTELEGVCTFRLPDELPDSPGKIHSAACGTAGIQFVIAPEVDCDMGCNADHCWQGCTPIPGKFTGRLAVDGTPARVDLTLSRDGAPVLVETAEPLYEDVYPNGPECDAVCRQASFEYTLE